MSDDLRTLLRNEARDRAHLAGQPDPLRLFVLDCGMFWRGGARHPRPGPKKECFRNAADLALFRAAVLYVEGFALRPGLPLAFHHAWLVESEGERMRVIDPTWDDPEDCQYLGVPVERETLRRRVLDTGYWGALDPQGFGVDLEWLYRVWGWEVPAHAYPEGDTL